VLRAGATAFIGLGVTLASTFISALHLSEHQQQVGFALGVALILLGAMLFVRSVKTSSRPPSLPDRLYKLAGEIDAFFHARWVQEPRPPVGPLGEPIGSFDEKQLEQLEAYRKKTMALYYEQHQANATAICDEALALKAFPAEHRQTVHHPNGTAALRLVPGLLRDAADVL
jgi:hypothetical protein